jgi:hypothetical protein
MDSHAHSARRLAAVTGIVLGLAAGSYGIANAASGSSSAGSTAATTTTSGLSSSSSPSPSQAGPTQQPAPDASPWSGQRSDETLLAGDAKAKVQAAALAKVSGGTIVRVETDADGHAAYEAHMTRQDGTPVTVYVDKQFDVVSVETR